jgi:N-acetylmuramoyl-L-alanine amidase
MIRIVITFILSLFVLSSANGVTQEQVIAITILGEARGEGESGMYAVACVISQRAKERKLTGAQVCLQKLQFSCNNKELNRKLLDTPQAAYAMMLAKNIDNLDLTLTKQANHYHTKRAKPYWSKGKQPVATIGNHLFFKL